MRRSSVIAAACALAVSSALLVGCASETADPELTRESLREIAETTAPQESTEQYDVSVDPEPIVEATTCSRYLVITARGTGEPVKKQLLASVAKTVSGARPGEVQELNLEYPADTDMKAGGTLGARTLIDTLNVQAKACPKQSFVLLGYSQGALVIGDALASPEYRLVGLRVGEVSAAAAARVRAIVLYGNPRFLGTEPYNAGTFNPKLNGILPRPAGGLAAYADRLRDYCVKGDFVCQSNLTTELDDAGHISYYKNGMQQDGAAFVITQLPPIDETSTEASSEKKSSAAPSSTQADENTKTPTRTPSSTTPPTSDATTQRAE